MFAGSSPTMPFSSFRIPNDFDPQHHELWTVRIPYDLDVVSAFEGRLLNLDRETHLKVKDRSYTLHYGSSIENESFRLIIAEKQEENSDNEDNEPTLRALPYAFQRHMNVVSTVERTTDTELAPRAEVAPSPVDPMRHAYAHVPQKNNLKRRWSPFGATRQRLADPVDDSKPPAKRKGDASSALSNEVPTKKIKGKDDEDQKKQRKAEKKAKKEAKKKKKESKKEKKKER